MITEQSIFDSAEIDSGTLVRITHKYYSNPLMGAIWPVDDFTCSLRPVKLTEEETDNFGGLTVDFYTLVSYDDIILLQPLK